MTKNFQEITLNDTITEVAMVGSPGIIEITGTFGTADVEIVTTNDETTLSNNTAQLALPTATDPILANPIIAPDVAFNVQAERLTFRALTPDGTTDITVRWFNVGTPY